MKIIKKSILVLGAMTLALGLFSFQSPKANELDLGTTRAYTYTQNYNSIDSKQQPKMLTAATAKGVRFAAAKAIRIAQKVVHKLQVANAGGPQKGDTAPKDLGGFTSDQLEGYKLSQL